MEIREIAKFIKDRGIKQRHFAGLLGVNEATLSAWLRGSRNPPKTALLAMELTLDKYYRQEPKLS